MTPTRDTKPQMGKARTAETPSTEALSWAAEIGERLRTQDNRITALPIFAVQQRVRIYGLDDEYADRIVWLDCCNDYAEATPEEYAKFEALHNEGEDVGDWQRTGYRDLWEFVTCCLTEQGCKDYIKVNGHNLKEPRIYAYSGYRNAEWEKLRKYFLSAPVPNARDVRASSQPPLSADGVDTSREAIGRLIVKLDHRGLVDYSDAMRALLAERDRLRKLCGEFVNILHINDTPYGKGVSIPTSIDKLLDLVERARTALNEGDTTGRVK